MQPDTRTAILDAAQELIQVHGSNGISYQTISEIVHIRKASIHYHFPTKELLIEEVLRRYCSRFHAQVEAIVGCPDPALTRLRAYMALFERTLEEEPGNRVCLCGMLGAELASLGSPALAILHGFYRANAVQLARILEDGRTEGGIHSEGDANTLAMLVFSSLEGAMLIARADGGIAQFRSMEDQLLKLIAA